MPPQRYRWLKAVLVMALVASVATLPSTSSAQTIGSTEPKVSLTESTTYRDVVVSVDGHEPQTIWSGEASSYSEVHVNELLDDYLEERGIAGSGSVANGASESSGAASSARHEIVTCDRTTDLNFHTYPYREVIGEVFAMCFGQFKWVELTGTLRLKRSWRSDKVLDEETDVAYYSWEPMNATPDALCNGTSTSAFRARNVVEITFSNGRTQRLYPIRETPWHWYRCSV
ncbi:MAG: hypothetical protein OXF65_12670 [Acidimicrobiaceae bacterium]|nr:hypothetical protein [Acidimicrobiaceae bacterium]